MSPITQGIAPHRSLDHAWRRLVDGVAIAGSTGYALTFTPNTSNDEWIAVSAAALLTHYSVAELSGLYRNWRGSHSFREIACILLTCVYAVPLLLGVGLLSTYNAHITYSTKLCWILLTPSLLILVQLISRYIQHRLYALGYNTKRVAICGVNELSIQLARNLIASPELGLRVTAFYDDRPDSRIGSLPADLGQCEGSLDKLVSQARRGVIDIVYITFPMRAEKRIQELLTALGDTTASVYLVPDFFVFELLHARWTNINGLPVVSVFENPLYGVDGLVKRGFDLLVSSLLLLVLALPMLVIALAVKWTSPGPVFFRQRRYGLDGHEIRVWKFRSMTCCEDGRAAAQATKNDQRITPIGGLLRRTSLDELPQLFNVLAGSMSLVGPRPHMSAHNEQYRSQIDGYMLRHKVKPGITGLAQVNGFRGETATLDKMEGRIRYDHRYIREWSLWMDLKILWRTIGVVWKQENAY